MRTFTARLAAISFCVISIAIGCDHSAPPPAEPPKAIEPVSEPSAVPADEPPIASTERPAKWAEPLADHPGLGNFHKITDTLYRGEQPTDAGFNELKKMGVKTVINLRTFHSDRENCERVGLNYVHIKSQAWHGEDEEVIEFLKAATNPENQPVFFHCQHGADRTGTMCAAYRIVIEQWSKEDAVNEMTDGGYGFHAIWENLIKFVKALDVEKIQAALK